MPRLRKRFVIPAAIVLAVVLVVVFWNWDWFIPLAEAQASAAIGRKVTIAHLHVRLARRPVIEADGVTIANPDGFPDVPPLAAVDRLRAQLDAGAYLRSRSIVIPWIEIDHPVIDARALPDGQNNFSLSLGGGASKPAGSGPGAQIGDLRIADGHAHVLIPKLRADFQAEIATREAPASAAPAAPAEAPASGPPAAATPPAGGQIVVDAKGTYADQPITGRFVGGTLLSLRDKADPYPVDLHLANGPTHVSLVGTIEDPVAFQGANLKLELAGPDMAKLYPLTGVPIPETPAYSIAGQLDYADRKIRFTHFAGRVGRSDLEGEIDVDPAAQREQVTANLASRLVDLADLGGFIGSTPGQVSEANQSAAQKRELERAEANPRLIPNVPINLPKLRSADIDLHYRGEKIEGRSVPFDSILTHLTIEDGRIAVHPLTLTVGRGEIIGNFDLDGREKTVQTRADIDFRQVDVGRLMSATHTFGGAGAIGGRAMLAGSGNSLAALLGDGNGELKLFMNQGGDLSALLIDLSGLEVGNAILSALGVPRRAEVRCLVTDFALTHGVLDTRTFLLDTTEANVTATGDVNLRDEDLNLRLRTKAKHFSIGSFPTDILIKGDLKKPSIGPDPVELGARVGAAVGLGVLLTPLGALLPTIQLGLGEDNSCAPLIRQAETAPSVTPNAPRAAPRRATR